MKANSIYVVFILFYFGLLSCENESENTPTGLYSKGVVVINEGSPESTVSFIQTDSGKVYNNIYASANDGASLGSYAQSASYFGGKYYIMVSSSNKIEVVNQTDFKSLNTITGVTFPRYMLVANSQKAYVSQWGQEGVNGSVAVVNLSTNAIEKKIKTGIGPEKMALVNNSLFVTNCEGYDSFGDSTVTVINTNADTVSATIKTGYNPKSIVVDKNNKVWVMCMGTYTGLPSSLVCIDPATSRVVKKFTFAGTEFYPRLTINKAKDALIYYYGKNVYEMSINATQLPNISKISHDFYNIAADPSSGEIYGAYTKITGTSGYIVHYTPAYEKVDSFKVQIIPGDILFNK